MTCRMTSICTVMLNMFSYIGRIISYILLVLFRWRRYDAFVNSVIQHRRKRHVRVNLPGLPDALDEVTRLPDGISDDLEFVGFDSNGCWLSCRIQRLVGRSGTHVRHEVLLDVPGAGRFRYENVDVTEEVDGFGRAAVTLSVGKAMKHWRVQFNGPLQQPGGDGTGEEIHGVISLYWQCMSDPYSNWATPSNWQLAKSVSRDGFRRLWARLFKDTRVCYEQWGELWGRIYIEGHGERNVRLKSVKRRELCPTVANTRREARVSSHLVVDVKGLMLMYSSLMQDNTTRDMYGFVTYPISASHLADVMLDTNTLVHKPSTVSVSVSGASYTMQLKGRKHPFIFGNNGIVNHSSFVNFDLDGRMCYGVESCRSLDDTLMDTGAVVNSNKFKMFDEIDNQAVAVSLMDYKSTSRLLCGGKGASLGVLLQSEFRVPSGICLTANAFLQQINTNRRFREAIETIRSTIGCSTVEGLQKNCADAVRICLESEFDDTLKKTIKESLLTQFGPSIDDIWLAVRSSAVDEDGRETSAAGQLHSSLGVRGLPQIYDAIRKCWASSLEFRVVEYRRQNGQPATTPTAVVIQEMVAADTAGVLFTNDPVTGNPWVMVVNAVHGLGETIVSGTVNPDTFRVRRTKNDLAITDILVGEKQHRLVLDIEDGLQQLPNKHQESTDCSLTDENVLRICETGRDIETLFDTIPQDIEWAMHNDEIYILQSRAITNIDIETDEEVVHEFESPVASDEMYLTTCNASEVCPEITTPLMSSDHGWLVDMAMKNYSGVVTETYFPRFPDIMLPLFTGRFMINMTAFDYGSTILFGDKCDAELGIMGKLIEDHTKENVLECFGEKHSSSFTKVALFLSSIFKTKLYTRNYDEIWDRANDISFPDDMPLGKLCEKIDQSMEFLRKSWCAYIFMLNESVKWTGILIKILKGGEEINELPLRVKSDLALLLSDCPGVVSADIPQALEGLVKLIANSDVKDQFTTSPICMCHDLLLNANSSDIRESYKRFLSLHGHRGYMEYDFRFKSWAMDPAPLMEILQHILVNDNRESTQKRVISVAEAVDGIETKLSPVMKYMMKKMLVPYARTGVGTREKGKSILVKVVEAVKKGYWKLADQLVREGRLPNKMLLFYFTHSEMAKLIETRSVGLIRKAKRRMKIAQLQTDIKYHILSTGKPVAMCAEPRELPISRILLGLPVCRGKVQARARVLENISEMNTIQAGDILICPLTDVGWSPCFPLLSGLVTEIGGIISHGAVIAREYGIPCVVSVEGATKVIKSGDTILIDGTAGKVELINNLETE